MTCKGCRTLSIMVDHKIKVVGCIIQINAPKKIIKCPCRECIVKTSCFIQCQKFKDLCQSIFELRISYDYKNVKVQDGYNHSYPERAYYERLNW